MSKQDENSNAMPLTNYDDYLDQAPIQNEDQAAIYLNEPGMNLRQTREQKEEYYPYRDHDRHASPNKDEMMVNFYRFNLLSLVK